MMDELIMQILRNAFTNTANNINASNMENNTRCNYVEKMLPDGISCILSETVPQANLFSVVVLYLNA